MIDGKRVDNRFSTPLWPTEIRLKKDGNSLEVVFEDQSRHNLPAEYLRVESPSAEVQGHGADTKVLVSGRRHVRIIAIEPVGNYAVRLRFDDGHDTGIFTWRHFQELGTQYAGRWKKYLDALTDKDLSRDPS